MKHLLLILLISISSLSWADKKAVNQEDPNAQYNLGLMYYFGQGVTQNKIKAYQYWLQAAKQGHANAQDALDMLCKESPWACN